MEGEGRGLPHGQGAWTEISDTPQAYTFPSHQQQFTLPKPSSLLSHSSPSPHSLTPSNNKYLFISRSACQALGKHSERSHRQEHLSTSVELTVSGTDWPLLAKVGPGEGYNLRTIGLRYNPFRKNNSEISIVI